MTQFTFWQDGGIFIGYLNEYPDYGTQGGSMEELKLNLKDIYKDITGGLVPCARKVMDLDLA